MGRTHRHFRFIFVRQCVLGSIGKRHRRQTRAMCGHHCTARHQTIRLIIFYDSAAHMCTHIYKQSSCWVKACVRALACAGVPACWRAARAFEFRMTLSHSLYGQRARARLWWATSGPAERVRSRRAWHASELRLNARSWARVRVCAWFECTLGLCGSYVYTIYNIYTYFVYERVHCGYYHACVDAVPLILINIFGA